jgi:hypothetical protein
MNATNLLLSTITHSKHRNFEGIFNSANLMGIVALVIF